MCPNLETVEMNAFAGCQDLHNLTIANNPRLKTLQVKDVDGDSTFLQLLQHLDISRNNIRFDNLYI